MVLFGDISLYRYSIKQIKTMTFTEELDKALIKLMVKSLIAEKRLLAIKIMKYRYDIGLKEAKEITDGVVNSTNDGKMVFLIRKKKDIKSYLKESLKQYDYKLDM